MYQRNLHTHLLAALQDTPVVLLNGARQTGKSTLVKMLAQQFSNAHYFTLDDMSVLSSIRHDPAGFVSGLPDGLIILDEIQRAPDLLLAIKEHVDQNRRAGRFLLTGSANVLLLPKLADSLAGRMEILTLWPLAQQELHHSTYRFIDKIFEQDFQCVAPPTLNRADLIQILCRGGYPDAHHRNEARRHAWFESYLATVLQRDIKDLAHIEGLTELPRLLQLLATRHMGLANFADLSRNAGISQTTLKRYMALFEATFLISYLPPWFNNLGKRLVKTSKWMLNDTGLTAHLLGLSADKLNNFPISLGPLLESFVANELRKQSTWQDFPTRIFHFRTESGQEVDVVLENRNDDLVGIEIKASHTVSVHDFKGLHAFAELTGERFKRGIIFYAGEKIIPFSKNYYALPLSLLWTE